jgi:hypothetical protein
VNFANVARRFAPYQGRIRRFAPEAEIAPDALAALPDGPLPFTTAPAAAESPVPTAPPAAETRS